MATPTETSYHGFAEYGLAVPVAVKKLRSSLLELMSEDSGQATLHSIRSCVVSTLHDGSNSLLAQLHSARSWEEKLGVLAGVMPVTQGEHDGIVLVKVRCLPLDPVVFDHLSGIYCNSTKRRRKIAMQAAACASLGLGERLLELLTASEARGEHRV